MFLNLRENSDCALAQIAFEVHAKHLAAIDKYRESVPFWKRRGFERAVNNYRDAHEMASEGGNIFAIALSENSDVARTKRKIYREAVNSLLSFA